MSERKPSLYTEDIRDAIRKINEYTKELSFDAFIKDAKTIDAVVRNLTIIGEAVKNIPEATKRSHREIPWNEIIGMRNKVIHEYFGVDEDILWKTIKEDLPVFERQIRQLR